MGLFDDDSNQVQRQPRIHFQGSRSLIKQPIGLASGIHLVQKDQGLGGNQRVGAVEHRAGVQEPWNRQASGLDFGEPGLVLLHNPVAHFPQGRDTMGEKVKR